MEEKIKVEKVHLNELLDKCNDLIIPYYQRNYDWCDDQIERLIYDILHNNSDEYYCGSVIIHKGIDKTVVDGQQRISTFLLFIKVFDEWKNNGNCGIDFYDVKKYRINSENLNDKKVLEEILQSDNVEQNVDKFKDSQYYKNFIKIKEVFHQCNDDEKYVLVKRFNKLTLSLISIADTNYDKYRLFTNINSTGLPLNAFDLCKNFIFSKLDQDRKLVRDQIEKKLKELEAITKYLEINEKNGKEFLQTEKAKNLNEIIRLFVAYQEGDLNITNPNMLFRKFEEIYLNKYKDNMEEMYESFIKFGHYLKFIKDGRLSKMQFSKPFRTINELFDTWIVLVIDILEKHSDFNRHDFSININSNQEKVIYDCFTLIEYYILSREFDGKRSNNLSRYVPLIKKRIENNNNNISYAAKLLNLFIKEESENLKMIPKEKFYKLLSHSDIYNKKKYCKNLLIRINEQMDKKANNNYNGIRIEHVMPQNISKWKDNGFEIEDEVHEHFVGTLGNLTILERELNSENSNDPFPIKKKNVLEKDLFLINNYFKKLDGWNITDIQERTKYLIEEYVKEIWNFSHLYDELNINDDELSIDINNIVENGDYFLTHYTKSEKGLKNQLSNLRHFQKNGLNLTKEKIHQCIYMYCVENKTKAEINRYLESKEKANDKNNLVTLAIFNLLEINSETYRNKNHDGYIELKKQLNNKIDEILEYINHTKNN